jgi:glutamate synthase domain-containing protein 3
MSGGVAYVYDEDAPLPPVATHPMVSMDKVHLTADQHTHDQSDWHDATATSSTSNVCFKTTTADRQ